MGKEKEGSGKVLGNQAGVAFLNPFSRELARDFENTQPTRSASVPASPKALRAFQFLISDLSSGLGRRQMLVIRAANGAEFFEWSFCKLACEWTCKNAASPCNGRASIGLLRI